MNIIMWFICLWYAFLTAIHSEIQPKELREYELLENNITLGKDYIPNLNVNPVTIQSVIRTMAYSDGLTVKKMQNHEH